MKKILMSVVFITGFSCLSFISLAQETEENVRVEYILCKLNDGFTFDDVIADAREYGEKVKENGNKYNQYLMRPMITGSRLEDYTHILAGVWPNGEELYKEYGNWVNMYIDEDNENSPHTCNATFATMDQIVVNDYREEEKTDTRVPVQLHDCSLKDGVSFDHAVEVQKQVAEAIREEGMGGYGVHFQNPYLGFEDVDFDFISMVWWQSFDHRATMAQNFYKIANTHGQKINAVMTCKEPRAYFSEELFTTW